MAVQMQPSSTRALDQFISTPELVLCVLEYLPPYDLLTLARASRYLGAIIHQSKALLSRPKSGPSKHFADLPTHVWAFPNVQLNVRDFPGWTYLSPSQGAVMPFPQQHFGSSTLSRPLISVHKSNPGTNAEASGPDEHLRIHLDWTTNRMGRRELIFDSARNEFMPSDRPTRRLLEDLGDKFPTDPPLPTTVSVSPISISPTPIPCVIAAAPQVVFSYRNASVKASLRPCTFGDMMKVVQALWTTSPRGWNSTTMSLEWRPREDYPHIASCADFDRVIDIIQAWPVVYTRVYCESGPIEIEQVTAEPPSMVDSFR